jgi:SAM-dependent methyltransferase
MTGNMISPNEVQADFDRIAALPEPGWDHNSHYHPFLLKHVPAACREALEIGCGTGAFSRQLADRAGHVTALDLSPNMIRIAQARSAAYANLDFRLADATTWVFPSGQFDCVVSLATFHHLPLEEMLLKIRQALKPHGRLIVLDLYKAEGLADLPVNLVAFPANILLKLIKLQRLREPKAARKAWAEHGRHDRYPTLSQVRGVCAGRLPGAQVRRHLLWRYSLIWERKDD